LNYYRRYVGDYLRDTARLSMLEHGAYNLLLDYYYAEERPISLEFDEVYRMVRALMPEEKRAIVKVLTTFFIKAEDGYRHKRVDLEIATAQASIEKQRQSGSESAAKRWGKNGSTDESTYGSTHTETHAATHAPSIQPPTTNLHPPSANRQPKQNCNVALARDAEAILVFLNEKTGRNYKPVSSNLKLIQARLRDGETAEDIRAVVAMRCRKWRGDPKMDEYLRPKTLFNATNYAQYRGELKEQTT
jgi:uncharacterized phage protein (TIGR02220 family)